MTEKINILQDLSETISYLTDKDSQFYSYFLADVDRVLIHNPNIVNTAAIVLDKRTYRLSLAIHPKFWLSLDRKMKRGICKHECLHIVLGHIYMDRENYYTNGKIFNIAIDLEVNQYIPKSELTLNGELQGVHISQDIFKELGFGDFKGTKYYYDKLIKAKNSSDTSDELKKVLEDYEFDIHDWDDIKELSDINKQELKDDINAKIQIIKSQIKVQGNLSDVLSDYVKKIHLRTKVSWKNEIRRFLANSIRTYIRRTVRKDSKRFEGAKGRWIKRNVDLLVILDTSGSMDMDTISKCFVEIKKLWRNTECVIKIAEVDTSIQKVYDYKGVTPQTVSGRGGTIFDDGIILANKLRPNGVIYFTDSYAAEPSIKCHSRMLWALTASAKNNTLTHLKGRKIFIE